ncbi:ANTAR domain-containing protein [Nesterenkonia salmonea]|uniref:ANTAR domain-containing protein n=1 Tax=Nesterenkonia salmonea TaxID=1804987 RepID=UPI0026D297A6
MESRTTIDLAAGIIIGQNRCSQEEAIAILKKASNHRNLTNRMSPRTKEFRMTGRVGAVAFNVLETLLDLNPIGERLEKVGQPADVLGPYLYAGPARRDGADPCR